MELLVSRKAQSIHVCLTREWILINSEEYGYRQIYGTVVMGGVNMERGWRNGFHVVAARGASRQLDTDSCSL